MQNPYAVGGNVYASNGTTGYPGVSVTVKNTTKNTSETFITLVDGSYTVDLANFPGGYDNGDSIKVRAKIGSFYKEATSTVDIPGGPLSINLTLATESATNIIDIIRVKEELVTFFRRHLDDPLSRGSSKTDAQSGTGSKVSFELPDKTAKVVTTVLVNNVVKTEYTDYCVDYKDKDATSKPIVYFLAPPADASTVEITYKYGLSWIYSDYPKADMTIDDYPRITVDLLEIRTKEGGLGSLSNITDLLGSVVVMSPKTSQLIDLINDIRVLILENKKNFNYFKLIIPQGTGHTFNPGERGDKILQLNQDFLILTRLEKI